MCWTGMQLSGESVRVAIDAEKMRVAASDRSAWIETVGPLLPSALTGVVSAMLSTHVIHKLFHGMCNVQISWTVSFLLGDALGVVLFSFPHWRRSRSHKSFGRRGEGGGHGKIHGRLIESAASIVGSSILPRFIAFLCRQISLFLPFASDEGDGWELQWQWVEMGKNEAFTVACGIFIYMQVRVLRKKVASRDRQVFSSSSRDLDKENVCTKSVNGGGDLLQHIIVANILALAGTIATAMWGLWGWNGAQAGVAWAQGMVWAGWEIWREREERPCGKEKG